MSLPTQLRPVVFGGFDYPVTVAASHEFGDNVGLALFLAQIENGDDMGVGAQPAHGLGLTLDADAGGFVQTVGLYQSECNFPVQGCVVG